MQSFDWPGLSEDISLPRAKVEDRSIRLASRRLSSAGQYGDFARDFHL